MSRFEDAIRAELTERKRAAFRNMYRDGSELTEAERKDAIVMWKAVMFGGPGAAIAEGLERLRACKPLPPPSEGAPVTCLLCRVLAPSTCFAHPPAKREPVRPKPPVGRVLQLDSVDDITVVAVNVADNGVEIVLDNNRAVFIACAMFTAVQVKSICYQFGLGALFDAAAPAFTDPHLLPLRDRQLAAALLSSALLGRRVDVIANSKLSKAVQADGSRRSFVIVEIRPVFPFPMA